MQEKEHPGPKFQSIPEHRLRDVGFTKRDGSEAFERGYKWGVFCRRSSEEPRDAYGAVITLDGHVVLHAKGNSVKWSLLSGDLSVLVQLFRPFLAKGRQLLSSVTIKLFKWNATSAS